MWITKKDVEARDKTRNQINEIYTTVRVNQEKIHHLGTDFEEQRKDFKDHIEDERLDYNNLCKKIDKLECPIEPDVKVVKLHQDELNGQLKRLADSYTSIKDKINAGINELAGENKHKQQIINKRNFLITVITCMLLGIGTFVAVYSWYKNDIGMNKNELKELILELKPE